MFLRLACDFSQRGHTNKKRKGIWVSCGTFKVVECKRQNHFRHHLSMFKSNRKEPTCFSTLWKPPLMKISDKNIIQILLCFACAGVHNLSAQRTTPSLDVRVRPRLMPRWDLCTTLFTLFLISLGYGAKRSHRKFQVNVVTTWSAVYM